MPVVVFGLLVVGLGGERASSNNPTRIKLMVNLGSVVGCRGERKVKFSSENSKNGRRKARNTTKISSTHREDRTRQDKTKQNTNVKGRPKYLSSASGDLAAHAAEHQANAVTLQLSSYQAINPSGAPGQGGSSA